MVQRKQVRMMLNEQEEEYDSDRHPVMSYSTENMDQN